MTFGRLASKATPRTGLTLFAAALCTAAILALAPVQVAAADGAPPPGEVSPESGGQSRFIAVAEAWDRAEVYHPLAEEARQRLDGLRRDVAQRQAAYEPTLSASVRGLSYRVAPDGTTSPPNPQPSLNASLKLPLGASLSASLSAPARRGASSDGSLRLQGGVGFNYPLFRNARLDGDALALRQAEAALAAAEREYEGVLDEIRADVLAALHADEVAAVRFALAEEAYAEAEDAWAAARRRAEEGIASEADLLGAQIERLRAEQEFLNARRTRQSRREQLLNLLGLPVEEDGFAFESVLAWTALPEPPPREAAVAAALTRNGALAERREAAEVARLQWEEEQGRPRFDSRLSVNYSSSASSSSDEGQGAGWTVSVDFTYPILDGGQRQRTLHSRKESYERALEAVEDGERAVRQQVDEAYVQLEDARRDEEIARLELTRAGLEMELLRRQAGLDVATAGEQALRQGERALLRAELAWREAVQRYQSRWVALHRLLGPVPWELLTTGPEPGGTGDDLEGST